MDTMTALHAWLAPRLEALRAATADEEGQGAVEYVGIVIVVVAIIAALAAFGDPIGTAIGNGLQNIVDGFVGG